MIGKLRKGRGIRGLTSYLLSAVDSSDNLRAYHAVIGGTITGDSVDEIVRQYRQFRALKPDLKNAVVHNSLRLPEGEKLGREQWRAVGETWAREMGLELYTIVQHEDDHAHIAGLRVRLDGSTVSDSRDYARSERVIRQLEKQYGLQQVAESHLLDPERLTTHRRAPTREQIGMHERTGKVAPSIMVQQALDDLTSQPLTVTGFIDQLEARGIEVRANIASTGKLSGFSYAVDGVALTSKTLGRGYTLANLQQKGLEYVESRDAARCRSTLVGAEVRADIAAERGAGADRRVSEADARSDRAERVGYGAAGGEHGDAARAAIGSGATDREDHEQGGRRQEGYGQDGAERPGLGGGHEERPTAGSQDRRSPAYDLTEADLDAGSDAVRVIGAYSGAGLRHVESAVSRTLAALPDEAYQVRLLRRDTGVVTTRTWSAEEIMKSIPWLRRENAHGKEILFRPTDSRYLLLDDVPPAALPEMRREGCAPALVTETSPGKLQAWMRLPEAVQAPFLTEISRQLVDRFGADRGAIGADRFGKLPGFTNRKPEREYERGGKILAPFVRLVEASGAIMQAGADLIRYARQTVAAAVTAQRARQAAAAQAARTADLATAWGQAQETELQRRRGKGEAVDQSALDFVATAQLLRAGYAADDLAGHLESMSQRHRDPADYARRTVEKAAESNQQRRGPTLKM